MAKGGKAEKPVEIRVTPLDVARMRVAVVGTYPYVCETMAQKAKGDILFPAGPKTATEKAQSLKHAPLTEYRDSAYHLRSEGAPTLLAVLASAFKGAIMTASLRIPGAKKTEIGQLVHVEGEKLPLYGVPQLFMAVVRQADISRTPDIRTRAILPEWAALFDITFVRPQLREKQIITLLAGGGVVAGVGGWRPEKGKGRYGSFRIANLDDPDLLRIIETGGRAAQQAAMLSPAFYDDDTEALYVWYTAEMERRGIAVPS